ncbi:MAG: SRPBCC family protein [Blastocatellia bacterium]
MISADKINEYAENNSIDYPYGRRLYQPRNQRELNVSEPERIASAIAGGAMAVFGIAKGGWAGWALALAGGGLVYRGATGQCAIYQALGVDTAHRDHAGVKHGHGIKIEKSVTINKKPEELYGFWRNFSNLPRFMKHLESVHDKDEIHSHWVAKAPAGMTVEWDAEVINEKENELIAWRSLEGASVPNAGSVRFELAPGNRGSVVRVSLSYEPPGGVLGSKIAKLFGEEPDQQVAEDLRRFKQLMEAGEIASTDIQPSGRAGARAARGSAR